MPPLLKKVDIENNTSGKSLSELLSSGEIDALLGALMPEGFGTDPNIVRLFPNFEQLEIHQQGMTDRLMDVDKLFVRVPAGS